MLCYDAWLHDGPMPANAETGATERESGEKLCSHDPGSAVSTTHLTTIAHRLRGASGVAISHYGEYCEDFILSGDINDQRGEAASVTGCGQRRQAASLHQSGLSSGWLGLTLGPIRSQNQNWSIYRKPGPDFIRHESFI